MKLVGVFLAILALQNRCILGEPDDTEDFKPPKKGKTAEILMQLVDTASNWESKAEARGFKGWDFPNSFPCEAEWSGIECGQYGLVTKMYVLFRVEFHFVEFFFSPSF